MNYTTAVSLARAQGHLTGTLGNLLLCAQRPLEGSLEQLKSNQGHTGTGLESDLRGTQNLSISSHNPGVIHDLHLRACQGVLPSQMLHVAVRS